MPSDPAYGAFHHLEAEAARRDKDDAAVDQVGSLYHDPRIAAAVVAVRVGTRAMLGATTEALGDALLASVAPGTPYAGTFAFGRADAGIIITFLDARAEEFDAEAANGPRTEYRAKQAAQTRENADALRDALQACGECGAARVD